MKLTTVVGQLEKCFPRILFFIKLKWICFTLQPSILACFSRTAFPFVLPKSPNGFTNSSQNYVAQTRAGNLRPGGKMQPSKSLCVCVCGPWDHTSFQVPPLIGLASHPPYGFLPDWNASLNSDNNSSLAEWKIERCV